MSVLKNAKNLVLGNGDLFLADTVADLPSLTAYKSARAAGTLGALDGNVGAIKGTASVQIIRELTSFEVGVPLEVADQTVIREGVHIKCALAELDLATIKSQIGGGNYSTTTAGSTLATTLPEVYTANKYDGHFSAIPFALSPVLTTATVPAAASDPVIKNAAETTTYVSGTDYTLDLVNNTFTPLESGGITDGEVLHVTSYYTNPPTAETLTGGGQADVSQVALRFFHYYKDGRVLMFTMYKANPVGTVTLPFEEIAYGNTELEFKGLADFTRITGDHLYEVLRELY